MAFQNQRYATDQVWKTMGDILTLKAPAYQIYSTENIWDGYLLKIMIHSCSCTKTFAKKIVESQDLFCFCPKLIFLLLELQDCSRRSDVFCGNPSNYVILASDVSILRCRHINNTQYHQNTALLHFMYIFSICLMRIWW